MHTGPQPTAPTQSRPGGGRGPALIIGAIAFALVFLLIVAGAVGFLVWRGSGTSAGGGTGESKSTASSQPPQTETSASAKPFDEGEYCYRADRERTSENPSGRLRGGGLEFVPPAAYDSRSEFTGLNFANDITTAVAPVEESWVSTASVGAIALEPGVEYPGAEIMSKRMVDCLYSNGSIWGDTKQRTLGDEFTEPVTIAGMPGFKSSAIITFGQHKLTKTSATEIVVVVVDTPEGPSFFATDTAVGVKEHEDAQKEALASLTGLSG